MGVFDLKTLAVLSCRQKKEPILHLFDEVDYLVLDHEKLSLHWFPMLLLDDILLFARGEHHFLEVIWYLDQKLLGCIMLEVHNPQVRT